MNNKHKLKRIKWGSLITISCLIGAILLNTSAKSLSNSKTKAKKLANKTTACTVESFNPEITMTTGKDEKNVKVTTKIKKNSNGNNFWLFISSGKVKVKDKNGKETENVIYELTESFTKSKSNIIEITNPISEIYVVIVYKDGTANGCGITNEATAKEIADDYVKNDGKFSDTMKNKISKNYYVAEGQYKILEISDDGEIDMIDSDDDDISRLRTAAEEAEKEGDTAKSTEYDNMTPEGKVNDLAAINLYCSKNNVYKEGVTEGKKYYTNQQTYYFEETKNEDNCETTCKETVKVQYGPPVATKAGMCFEYKVKVQSKVACKSTWKGGAKPQKQKLCNIYPVCNSSKTFYDQAGPDEEFDSCIDKCDNGKYSQNCINKCYKSVYENVNNKKISYNDIENNSNSKLLANKKNSLPGLDLTTESEFCDKKNNQNEPTFSEKNYNDLIKAMRSYDNGCEYKYNGEKITWSCAESNWSKEWQSLGRYYFLTDDKAKQTLQSIATTCVGEPRGSRYYHYYIDSEGFKRATFGGERHCQESCEWVASAKTGKPNVDCMVSKSERDKEYKKQLNDYIADKRKCQAKAACSTKMATFTISAKDANGDEHTFSAKVNNSKTAVSVTVDSANSISPIIASGGCYGKEEGNYDYMTEWSFPGSWISKKNGKVIYKAPQNNKDAWYLKKGYYCTPFNSKGVNSDWFDWATNTKLKNKSSYESSKVTYEKNNISYNISATTENFGYFGWKFNINCFYATPTLKNTNTPSTPDDPKTPDTDNPKFEYEARSVDTKEMFPEESRGSGDEQIIGFNWTEKANENLEVGTSKEVTIDGTELPHISYEIKPEALKENIKKQAEDGKTYSDDNLEYYVQLNRKALKDLKGMTIGKFNGTFEPYAVGKEGVKLYTIQRYKTDLIDKYGGTRRRRKLCNNWDNGNCRTYS